MLWGDQPASDGSFPEEVAPFPDTAEIFCNQPIDRLPAQKLRPIRYNGRVTPEHSHSPSTHELLVAGACGSRGNFQSSQRSNSIDSSAALGFLSLPDFHGLHQELDESGGAPRSTRFSGSCNQAMDVAAVLREINPESGVESLISKLKRQISQLDSATTTSSSSEHSGYQGESLRERSSIDNRRSKKRREQMESFLEDLMNQVMYRQEQMHKQLIEMIEKKEAERIIREEEWKRQEIERMRKDESIRAQEASRNLALISFIQSAMDHADNTQIPLQQLQPTYKEEDNCETSNVTSDPTSSNNNDSNAGWPKSEIQALIALRCALDHKFCDSLSSKLIVWEEVSASMAKMGYSQSGRKCKEKWEIINKNFKKMIESRGKCPETSKSCPYFQGLEVLYRNGLLSSGTASSSQEDEDDPSTEN